MKTWRSRRRSLVQVALAVRDWMLMTYKLAHDVLHRVVQGKLTLIKSESEELNFFRFNEMATEFLPFLTEGVTKEGLTSFVLNNFEISQREAEEDIDQFLQTGLRHNLIVSA